ncbi:hypothetical protein K8P10_001269 [Leucobacter sp. Psy1]|nr:hypothetical protein K8P10_001269 [Leucobacter sp. Psy1]
MLRILIPLVREIGERGADHARDLLLVVVDAALQRIHDDGVLDVHANGNVIDQQSLLHDLLDRSEYSTRQATWRTTFAVALEEPAEHCAPSVVTSPQSIIPYRTPAAHVQV